MGTLFGNYITVLREAKMETSKPRIVRSLFKVAGATEEPDDPVIKKWLYCEGNDCRAVSYFENGKINEDGEKGIIAYFMERPHVSWESLREKFRLVDNLRAVDCNALNRDDFYRSLLDEFLVWLKLPISKRPTDKQSSSSFNAGNDELEDSTLSNRMLQIFQQEYNDCHIKEFLASDQRYEISRDLLAWVDQFVESIESDVIQIYPYDKLDDKSKIMYESINRYAKTLCRYKSDLVKSIARSLALKKQAPASLVMSINRYLINNPGEDTVTLGPFLQDEPNNDILKKYRKSLDALYTVICSGDIK